MAKPPTVSSFWQVYAGDDSTVRIVFHGRDISEYTDWRAAWRPTWDSSTVYEIDTTVSNDTVALHLPGSASAYPDGVVRSGVWDVQAKRGSETITLIRGGLNWIGDVTR